MPDYKYSVSLSISHPSIDPDSISRKFGITPIREHRLGGVRKTHTGEILEGNYESSFWRARLHESERLASTDILLEDFLAEQNARFAPHKEYFRQLVESGGYVEYFIGWFEEGTGNISASFSSELLSKTSALKIAIGLDVYSSH